ncbi:hypothetical protein DLAC_02920 [Tieghemostelium lacteum]|uniref:Uncharacterized protein n=1 Tax=Tieghemostelium lacteum TaxID=361077 RepID=A0A152A3M0_TIELA|nr:hypothetical protein DLAC_02920 [Tieghemostelium lacteum]|eukprot:KYR00862.1 hypothetical protein DLAC_02920 [Tieghemostelium lacteum]
MEEDYSQYIQFIREDEEKEDKKQKYNQIVNTLKSGIIKCGLCTMDIPFFKYKAHSVKCHNILDLIMGTKTNNNNNNIINVKPEQFIKEDTKMENPDIRCYFALKTGIPCHGQPTGQRAIIFNGDSYIILCKPTQHTSDAIDSKEIIKRLTIIKKLPKQGDNIIEGNQVCLVCYRFCTEKLKIGFCGENEKLSKEHTYYFCSFDCLSYWSKVYAPKIWRDYCANHLFKKQATKPATQKKSKKDKEEGEIKEEVEEELDEEENFTVSAKAPAKLSDRNIL